MRYPTDRVRPRILPDMRYRPGAICIACLTVWFLAALIAWEIDAEPDAARRDHNDAAAGGLEEP